MREYIQRKLSMEYIPLTFDSFNIDSIRGMFLGGSLGDAMGSPHEYGPPLSYSSTLKYRAQVSSRYTDASTGKPYFARFSVGQVTDDTEMMLCILHSILEQKGYRWKRVVEEYMRWANSEGTRWIGVNTRKMFKGIKTEKGFLNRHSNAISEGGKSQSNGTLMRIAPLMLFDHPDACIQDCILSNVNTISVGCSLVYYYAIRYIWGYPPPSKNHDSKKDMSPYLLGLYKYISSIIVDPIIMECVNDAYNGVYRKINGPDKGWCVNGIYIALYCLFKNMYYHDALSYVIKQEGDTDTNACIMGYLLGAYWGEMDMKSHPDTLYNINTMLNVFNEKGYYKDTQYKREPRYTLHNFEELMSQLTNLICEKKSIIPSRFKRLSKLSIKRVGESSSKTSHNKTPTRVVKIQRKNGVVVQDCDIYIGRACFRGGWELKQSIYHNPFKAKDYDDIQECLDAYEKHVRNSDKLIKGLIELKGKVLGCWCGDKPCHGNVLVNLIEEYYP